MTVDDSMDIREHEESTDTDIRETILDDVRRVADDLGRPPTRTEWNEHGHVTLKSMIREFESYRQVLSAAGFSPLDAYTADSPKSPRELADDIRVATREIGRPPTKPEMAERGVAIDPYIDEFGSWQNAIMAAGLDPSNLPGRQTHRDGTTNRLLNELNMLAAEVGGTPTKDDVRQHSSFTVTDFENRFGTFASALCMAGF